MKAEIVESIVRAIEDHKEALAMAREEFWDELGGIYMDVWKAQGSLSRDAREGEPGKELDDLLKALEKAREQVLVAEDTEEKYIETLEEAI